MRALTVIVSAMLLGSAITANWTLAKPQTWTIGWRLTPLPKMPISHDQIICHQHLAPDRRCFTELAVGFSTVAVARGPPLRCWNSIGDPAFPISTSRRGGESDEDTAHHWEGLRLAGLPE
jgi:hypothetical protein